MLSLHVLSNTICCNLLKKNKDYLLNFSLFSCIFKCLLAWLCKVICIPLSGNMIFVIFWNVSTFKIMSPDEMHKKYFWRNGKELVTRSNHPATQNYVALLWKKVLRLSLHLKVFLFSLIFIQSHIKSLGIQLWCGKKLISNANSINNYLMSYDYRNLIKVQEVLLPLHFWMIYGSYLYLWLVALVLTKCNIKVLVYFILQQIFSLVLD